MYRIVRTESLFVFYHFKFKPEMTASKIILFFYQLKMSAIYIISHIYLFMDRFKV